MRLEDDMGTLSVETHLDQLDMNFETDIESDHQNTKHIIQYCDNLPDKIEIESINHITSTNITNQSFPSSRTESDIDDPSDVTAAAFSLQSTNDVVTVNTVNAIILQYTKSTKNALFENALNNSTIDETGINW